MAMTMRVGIGSLAPMPANRLAKVGMTFHMMMMTTQDGHGDDDDRVDHGAT